MRKPVDGRGTKATIRSKFLFSTKILNDLVVILGGKRD